MRFFDDCPDSLLPHAARDLRRSRISGGPFKDCPDLRMSSFSKTTSGVRMRPGTKYDIVTVAKDGEIINVTTSFHDTDGTLPD